MRLTIRLLGTEVFHASTDPDEPQSQQGPGDCTTYPVGFTAWHERPDEADLPVRGFE